MVKPMDNGTTEVQTVAWYDNENSYTSNMVRTIKYFAESVSYTHLDVYKRQFRNIVKKLQLMMIKVNIVSILRRAMIKMV